MTCTAKVNPVLELREEGPSEQELLEKKEKAHVARSEEEELALFMVNVSRARKREEWLACLKLCKKTDESNEPSVR